MARPVLVVDAANVVGSVPDGWWRDRHGATERLRDRLVAVSKSGLPGLAAPDVVLVTEGAARRVTAVPGVEVIAAAGSGDDTIVDVAARWVTAGRAVTVVTADRELRRRVGALGAAVLGPSAVPR
ncbi:MAG: NTP pyrophosphohydrolase [Gordonia sp. (in: high G+C Gram-positive bacteria)]